jgi:thiamine-phosphate pyrophosphorylase
MFRINHAIYAILDTEVTFPHNIDIFAKADQLARYGVDIFQLRAHGIEDDRLLATAKKLAGILKKRNKIFIINDRADIAYLSYADGLHLGETDIPVSDARKIIGKKKIIGKTCHSNLDTRRFQREAVDYTSVGPVFKTATKPLLNAIAPSEIRRMVDTAQKTIFAIGGISLYNIKVLREYGITNAAFCRTLLLAKDPRKTINEIKECLIKISSKK